MNARLISKLDYPYREMLQSLMQSLKDVKGHDEFLSKFIGPKVRKNDYAETNKFCLDQRKSIT